LNEPVVTAGTLCSSTSCNCPLHVGGVPAFPLIEQTVSAVSLPPAG